MLTVAMEAVGADTCSIVMPDISEEWMEFKYSILRDESIGQWLEPPRLVRRKKDESTLVGKVYLSQQAMYDPDMNSATALGKKIHSHARATLDVPLTGPTKQLGVLACDRFEPNSL